MGSAKTAQYQKHSAQGQGVFLWRPKLYRVPHQLRNQSVKMSFLRRGNSCVAPDMEIRKRLEVRRYFDKADKDGNGSLTKEEWFNVLNSSGVPTTEEEVQEFFGTMDRDFDQKLTFAEFMGEESHIEKLFKSMDKNNDGFVTKKEFNDVCQNLSEEQVRLAFKQFDTSGDNWLNYNEFCLMIIKREQERLDAAH